VSPPKRGFFGGLVFLKSGSRFLFLGQGEYTAEISQFAMLTQKNSPSCDLDGGGGPCGGWELSARTMASDAALLLIFQPSSASAT